ncbi:sigma-54-dependent Fis family transcriptional regulator [Cupriavidus sp. UYPR2.512]|uniref:sigma-54-dependent Fis family transcriptional regulator n=1 Tax=Cupriavidus sp. UYPR2.512 TaxID=1080187 RepID=UPI0018DF28FF|nr:sigma-54-dependent Fis family transcriptional regulator [Cupriavidus sp. UYPR2.512]
MTQSYALRHARRVSSVVGRASFHEAAAEARLFRSWTRSLNTFQLDPGNMSGPRVISAAELKDRRNSAEALLRFSNPVVERLHGVVGKAGYCVLVADADGALIDFRGQEDRRKEYRQHGLYHGRYFTEDSEGTSAVACVLADKEPITVHTEDHFRAAFTCLTCTAAPIISPSGELTGVLDVSAVRNSENRDSQELIYAWVCQAAEMIENACLLHDTSHLWTLYLHRSQDYLSLHPELLIAFDDAGNIVSMNRQAKSTLSALYAAIPANVQHLFDLKAEQVIDLNSGPDMFPLRLSPGGDSFFARLRPPRNAVRAMAVTPEQPAAAHAAHASRAIASAQLVAGDAQVSSHLARALQIVDRRIPMLLQGETGTGKEAFALAVHRRSLRASQPFVAVNCAAIPDTLIESELFGYAEGAFTGAKRKGLKGKILQAHGSTLFLDEIGDMALPLQTRLLRVLAENELVPLGSEQSVRVDINLICATHRDLARMVSDGIFREDLYYRLTGAVIRLPPLRDRSDLGELIDFFLADEADAHGSHPALSSEALACIRRYRWPGNVRQLRMALRYACALAASSGVIAVEHLPDYLRCAAEDVMATPEAASSSIGAHPFDSTGLRPSEHLERERIVQMLACHHWRVKETAKALGMSRATIYRKMARYNIVYPGSASLPGSIPLSQRDEAN